jgi:hypothetical protein
MSHISRFDAGVREATVMATPNPRALGLSVRDFCFERDAVATPRRFAAVATPTSRRIRYQARILSISVRAYKSFPGFFRKKIKS